MNGLSNRCGQYREDLCLLASGVLVDQEKAVIENHLSACADCRKYYDEVSSLTLPLANWENAFSHIQSDQAVEARWARDFSAATKPHQRQFPGFALLFLNYLRELIWPCRRVWAGFSAVWLALLVVNVSTHAPVRSMAMKGSRPSPELVRAYLEEEGLPVDWTRAGERRVAEPPKPAVPRPRSELIHPLLLGRGEGGENSPLDSRIGPLNQCDQSRDASGYGVPPSGGGAWANTVNWRTLNPPGNAIAPPANPKGIAQQSPGLRGTSYPGNFERLNPQPQRGCGFGIARIQCDHRAQASGYGVPPSGGGPWASTANWRILNPPENAIALPPEGGTPYADAKDSVCPVT